MKNIFLIVLLLFCCDALSQTREEVKASFMTKPTIEGIRKTHPNACYFYASASDYYANKPSENIEWVPYSYSMILGSTKIEMIRDGKSEKTKLNSTGFDWMSNERGMLMRKYQDEFYIVALNGPLCYYVQYQFGDISIIDENNYYASLSSPDNKFFSFYSETFDGDLIKMSDKAFKVYLEKYNLNDQYEADKIKREKKDSVNDYHSKEINKLLKYMKLINAKIAEDKK